MNNLFFEWLQIGFVIDSLKKIFPDHYTSSPSKLVAANLNAIRHDLLTKVCYGMNFSQRTAFDGMSIIVGLATKEGNDSVKIKFERNYTRINTLVSAVAMGLNYDVDDVGNSITLFIPKMTWNGVRYE